MGLTNGSTSTTSQPASAAVNEVEEITVYELELEDDGSPSKQRSVGAFRAQV